jgi:hypothetical protein
MNEEEIKKIIEDIYDDSKEDSYRSMVRDFFSEKMRWVMIAVWVWFFIFMVPIIISVILFFMTNQTKFQIMYATIFVCCTLSIGFLKVLAWVMLQRHSIKREIKRLELRIAELTQTIKDK